MKLGDIIMILIWYDAKKDRYYAKHLFHYITNKVKVGDTNYYGHILKCMFYIESGTIYKPKLVQCNSYQDYRDNYMKKKQDFSKYDYLKSYEEK